jgi:hypothetical protein
MDDEIEVTIYIPKKAIKESGMGGCTIDLSFCDRKLCQATMRDGDDDKSLCFDNGVIEDIGEISDGS